MQAQTATLPFFPGDEIPPESSVIGQRVARNLQAVIEWSLGSTLDNRAVLDIGDNFSWSIPAKRVRVLLVVPELAQVVEQIPGILDPGFPVVPGGSWLSNISATISGRADLNELSGVPSHTVTEAKAPTSDLDLFYVPPFAREVLVQISPASAVPVAPMRWLAFEDPAVIEPAVLEFPTITPKTAHGTAIPGQAIALGRPAGFVGFINVTWTVRPS